jgi:hypothetical protein
MKYVEITLTWIWAIGSFGWILLAWICAAAAYANRLPTVPWSNVIIFDASNFNHKGQYYRTQAFRCIACWLIFSIAIPAAVALTQRFFSRIWG